MAHKSTMSFLLACSCTQPERLHEALAPVAPLLVAREPCAQWGFGYVRGGEVLLSRTPSPADSVDFFDAFADLRSDYVIAATDDDGTLGGPDNTPPYRSRRWLFGHTGVSAAAALVPTLVAHVPAFLQRTMRGKTAAEALYHLILAELGRRGRLEDPAVSPAEVSGAIATTLDLVRELAAEQQLAVEWGNFALTNGRTVVCARTTSPLFTRQLTVNTDKGIRDRRFRGVLVLSAPTSPAEGFEEIPQGSALLIHRDLRTEIAALRS